MTRISSKVPPVCLDRLEARVLLSGVSVSGGTLTIEGTPGDDTVVLRLSNYLPNPVVLGQWTVNFNGQLTYFDRSLIQRVQVSLGDGNDSFRYGDPDDNGELTTISGGNGNDTIMGSYRTDVIDGGAGNDVIDGWSGDDTIRGGPGSDTLTISQGVPKNLAEIFGGPGNDTISARLHVIIHGGFGSDLIHTAGSAAYGDAGNDTLVGDYGNDLLYGGAGNDSISGGGGGQDTLYGETGQDTLIGGAGGASLLMGGASRDLLISQPGATDTLRGGAGKDTLLGQAGEDVMVQ